MTLDRRMAWEDNGGDGESGQSVAAAAAPRSQSV